MTQSTAQQRPEFEFRVLIVDDHPLYSDAMAQALDVTLKNCVIETTQTLKETFEVIDRGFDPGLVLFDLKLPDVTGISGFIELRKQLPDARFLVISALASYELVHSLIEEGAMGFLPKDASAATLKYVVGEVMQGQRYVPHQYRRQQDAEAQELCAYHSNPELTSLTPQQIRILKLICVGKPNKQIAYELSLAEATVKAHITALLRRLGVQNRTQAVVMVEGAMARQGGSEPEVRAFLNQ